MRWEAGGHWGYYGFLRARDYGDGPTYLNGGTIVLVRPLFLFLEVGHPGQEALA